MHKFAHMSDVHLGAFRDPILQKLQLDCFKKAIDVCISETVDFILICGDLFHVGIPDLGIVREALKSMKKVQDLGIPIYVIYGSHDYTPTGTTVIDIIDTAGVIKKIVKGEVIEGKLKLDFFNDPKTGVKLVGISARKIGLERKYYEILDRESLENEEGFKIFGDGNQERAFLYVQDCVYGLMLSIEKISNADPINLGSNELVSIKELAQKIVNFSDKTIKIEYDLTGPQGTHKYCADTVNMEKLLDWKPRITLDEGLKRTYNWVKGKLNVAK